MRTISVPPTSAQPSTAAISGVVPTVAAVRTGASRRLVAASCLATHVPSCLATLVLA
ncbi:hypothetical protein [Streptomyces mexicanus]|uniref:hypothetical protein n=1 Tax=Streptomyces mexicanus TaxID=178566 RepID=UPI003B007249